MLNPCVDCAIGWEHCRVPCEGLRRYQGYLLSNTVNVADINVGHNDQEAKADGGKIRPTLVPVSLIRAVAEAGEKSGRAPLIAKLRAAKSESKRQMLDEAAAAIETLEAELREERYRFERYADFSVEQSKNIDRLYAEIMED